MSHDLVIRGARVIDPETGLDAVRDVGVTGGKITAISTEPLAAARTIEAAGLVLCPGFIDLHSHAQSRGGLALQALDGVTTALDLEAGSASVAASLALDAEEGRPINFGYSASWLLNRMVLMDGVEPLRPLEMFSAYHGLSNWKRPASSYEQGRILDAVRAEVAAGGIGIGVLVGYAPDSGRAEYFALAELAARLGVPTFTHTRFISTEEPGTSLEGALEVIAAASGTGAHMHMCHLNSTSNRMIDTIAGAVEHAKAEGVRITTEAYPYGSGSTVIGADFLAPEKLHRMGMTPDMVRYLPTGEWVADAARLAELRSTDPGGQVIMKWADERDEADREVLLRSLLLPDSAIASDAAPPNVPGKPKLHDEWPFPDSAMVHPRSTSCFAHTFGWLVRELEVLSLTEAVRRCTLLPAQFLAEAAPAMREKGRIQVGADADIVVFDPETIAQRGDYDTLAPSEGVRHLLVGGERVVTDGEVRVDSTAGKPVTGRGC
ncbi:amidohydrolase family protein [Sciscionella sediminilitoris]|uniref:amidohydrolase family protein n=1 Tax=Sciscionella sediminilitoris TaxID=1445613 RepID=UPI0004DF3B68|nr:amidohydrolase family protein [Sciscionella sp. SE31]